MNELIIPKGKSILEMDESIVAQFKRDFLDPTLSINELTTKYKRPAGTIYRYGTTDLGLHRPKLKVDNRTNYRDLLASIPKMVTAMPTIKFNYPIKKSGHTPASVIVDLSDLHFGRLTSTFKATTFVERMGRFGISIDDFISDMSTRYSIEELVLFFLGDFVLGEQLGKQVNVEEVEKFILAQIFEGTVPAISQWILDRLRVVKRIRVHAVRGNHGEIGKFQSKSANWDTFVYLTVEQRLHNQPEITFNIAKQNFYTFARVQDASFLLLHGEQFRGTGANLQTSATAKILRWNSTMPTPFDYVCFAHYHSSMKFMAGNIRCYCNGTLLSDDEWVRENLGLTGTCSQTILLVSGKKIEYEKEVMLK